MNLPTDKMPRFINRLKQKRAQMTRKARRKQNIFIVVTIVLLVFIVSSSVKIAHEYQQLQALQREQATLVSKNQKLKSQVSSLKKNVAQLKDSSYVEKLAREQYYLSKDGEQIYVLQSGGTDTATSSSNTHGTASSTQSSTSTSVTTTTN